MANFNGGLNLTGTGTSVAMSTLANCSVPLTGGQYAVWALTQPAYISLAVGSSLFTAGTGYPVINGTGPILVNVPNNGQIGCISTSSGVMVYEQVG